jgi:uncharacterized protein
VTCAAARCGLALLLIGLAACTLSQSAPRGPGDVALRRAERECSAGDPAACERAGRRYLQGSGIPQDPARAVEFLEQACSAQRESACVALGSARVMRGEIDQGRELYESACTNGSAEGCYALAELERRANPQRTVQLLGGACDRDFSAACYTLGAMLAQGRDVERDLPRAASLFERGCAAGDGRACFALGFQLQNGSGIERDPARASDLFARARRFFQERCTLGEGYACHNLALIYAGGLGTTARPQRAKEMLERACTLGSRQSCGVDPDSIRQAPAPL